MSLDAAVATLSEEGCVGRLAQLFPDACSLRIPIRLLTRSVGRKRLQERTVVEFGTAREVLFASNLPLEFEDRIELISQDGSFDLEAAVVAVRYHEGRKAVAARFVGEARNWVLEP